MRVLKLKNQNADGSFVNTTKMRLLFDEVSVQVRSAGALWREPKPRYLHDGSGHGTVAVGAEDEACFHRVSDVILEFVYLAAVHPPRYPVVSMANRVVVKRVTVVEWELD